MNPQQRLTQKIFQRLLQESEEEREERGRRRLDQAAGLAALVKKTSESVDIVLYDPDALLDLAEERGTENDLDYLSEVIVGVIGANRTFHPCNGAWEINKSAVKNKGDGGLVYGLAYAAAGGTLTPDRYSVSSAAQRGWLGQDSRGGEPFDDASLPPEERRTPDDPSDDCDLHRDGDNCGAHLSLPSLNRSYEAEGWEEDLLTNLRTAHGYTMEELGPNAKKFEAALLKNGKRFFFRHFK
jgi:hypothetical protein